MRIIACIGTRPDIIKMQPLVMELSKSKHELFLVHTGQHYDQGMSDIFLHQLQLPRPDSFLGVRSTRQGEQTGRIITKFETTLQDVDPDLLLVLGDTNSALGASIAASKVHVPVAHVEAGCRSFDRQMPEEINRTLISHIADLHMAPTAYCRRNLLNEGIHSSKIYVTGHTIVDIIESLKANLSVDILKDIHVLPKQFFYITFHRRESIEDPYKMIDIVSVMKKLSRYRPVIFLCHPHTRRQLRKYGLLKQIKKDAILEPVGYVESLVLIKNAVIVLTDSGGIQQESAILETPCITLRDSTEWVETVKAGINFVSGTKARKIMNDVTDILNDYEMFRRRFRNSTRIFGEMGVSRTILRILEKRYES